MKLMKQLKKGVSLTVLVITIIVMIIITSVVLLSLGENSVIDKANQAVEATNLKRLQEMAGTIWGEERLKGKTDEELEEIIKDKISKIDGIDIYKYDIYVTNIGVEVRKTEWKQKGFTVTKGRQVLNIGDIVNYDETKGGTIEGLTPTQWKVLGATDDGELLLMSTENIERVIMGSNTDLTVAQNFWKNVKEEFKKVCLPYGNGEKAIDVRGLTIEDIDKITDYDKITFEGAIPVSKYGNEVTYYWNGTDKPTYKYGNISTKSGYVHGKIIWYDYQSNSWKQATNPGDTITEEKIIVADDGSGVYAKIKSNYYAYTASQLTTISKEENNKAYTMLFGNDDVAYYLASNYVITVSGYCNYGLFYVSNGRVDGNFLMRSYAELLAPNSYIRAVVTLDKDTVVYGDSNSGWNIK